MYKKHKNNYNEKTIETIMRANKFTEEEIKLTKEYWKEIKEIDTDFDKEKTIQRFGIELEFAGCDTYVNSELIEDHKEDGSVNGDGLEINLHPIRNTEEEVNTFKEKAKKMMLSALEGSCEVDYSAGMHVHVSSPSLGSQEGANIQSIARNIFKKYDEFGVKWDDSEARHYVYDNDDNEYIELTKETYENMKTEGYDDEDEYGREITNVEGITQLKIKNEDKLNEKYKKQFEWVKFLYSTSEREGFENYGLFCDMTRGFTSHRTIELRVWRTTLDYRKLTARATIAMFWIYFVNKHIRLIHKGYEKYKDVNIWDELRLNKKAYDAYKYLAFCYSNKHNIGYTEEELIQKTATSRYEAKAIKEITEIQEKEFYSVFYKDAKKIIKNV